ncbi:hypothetical protein LCGC14_1272390 [marine sediment metagenome]|uniref:Uncharacterized protein n=1 Tax=marine sediment metagenome TaxID=412755 RepID=A0A0F9P0Q2_9ZZZZ
MCSDFLSTNRNELKEVNKMNNTSNIKVEKMDGKFLNYKSMEKEVYIRDTERLKSNSLSIIIIISFITLYWLIMIYKMIFAFLSILIFMILILLYLLIIKGIIIPNKLKEIYEKAYYVHGYILNEVSASVEVIEEYFFKPKEIDDFLTTLMSDLILEKRKCFKCKRTLNYIDFCSSNKSVISIHQIEKIWKAPHIQLFCCECYKKKSLFKKFKKKIRIFYKS